MIVKQIIEFTYEAIMCSDQNLEDIYDDLESVSLPLWDEMCHSEKLTSLGAIYEDRHTRAEDFTHSACCTPVEQATCAFCIQFFNQQDLLGWLMDDMDFILVKLRN